MRDVLFRVVTVCQGPSLGNHHRVEVLAADKAYRNQAPVPILGVASALDGTAPDVLKEERGGGFPAKEVPAVGVLALLLEFRRVDPKQPDAGSPTQRVRWRLPFTTSVSPSVTHAGPETSAWAGKASNATRAAAVHFNAVMAGWYTASS